MPTVKNKGVLNLSSDGDSLVDFSLSKKKGKGNTSPSSNVKFLDPDDGERHNCMVCSNVIGKKIDCIQCDNEKCSGWVHFNKCSKMTKAEFDFFVANPKTRAKWYCVPCEDNIAKEGDSVSDQQGKKIDLLTEVVKTMQQQLSAMFELINKSKAQPDTPNLGVEERVAEVMSEQSLREERKNNIILYNLPEADKNKDSVEQHDTDMQNVKDILNFVNKDVSTAKIESKDIERMGERKGHNETRPRPIKVVFPDFHSKIKIMKNAKKLAKYTNFRKIGLAFDKTKKEQLEDKILRDELNKKRTECPDDGYIIFKGKIMKSSDKPAWARRNEGSDRTDA